MTSLYRPPPVIAPEPASSQPGQATPYGHPAAHGHIAAYPSPAHWPGQTGASGYTTPHAPPHHVPVAHVPVAHVPAPPAYGHAPHSWPRAAPRKSKVHPAIIAIAILHIIAAAAGVAYFAIQGPTLHVHNDRDVAATVTVGDETLRVEPGEWRETNVPTDEATTVRAEFDDGQVRETVVDTQYGNCRREYHAVSLGGEQCYALVDISPLYEIEGPVRALHVYRQRRDLAYGVSDRCEDEDARGRYGRRVPDARYLLPGAELPDELFVERGERVVRMFAMPCTDGALEALLETIREAARH